MSTGLYSGVSGLALGTGLYKGTQGLWGGARGLINQFGATLNLDFLAGAPLDSRITFTRSTTATFVGSNGLIQSSAINAARFDYNPATLAPLGLLIEEQRVNLTLYSNQFDNAAWTKRSASVTANTTTSPDGTTNADRLTADGLLANHVAQQTVTYTAAAHTLSVYAKRDTNDFVQVRFGAAASAQGFANFDLNAGTLGTIGATVSSASITPAGNGWYRCTITATTAAVGSNAGFYIVTSATSGSAEVNTLTTSVFLYGAQLEAGAFATSYIPTVASTVTRAADNAVMTGTNFSSWYNQSEGTVVVDCNQVVGANSTSVAYAISDNTFNNSQYGVYTGGNAFRGANYLVGGVAQAGDINTFSVANVAVPLKDAFAYAVNNFGESLNGQTTRTDSVGVVNTASNRMYIGSNWSGGGNFLNGHIRTITYYATRLSNAQLQALTS